MMPCSCAGFRARILRVIGEARDAAAEEWLAAPRRPWPGPINSVRDPWCPRHGRECSMSARQAIGFYLDAYGELVAGMFGP